MRGRHTAISIALLAAALAGCSSRAARAERYRTEATAFADRSLAMSLRTCEAIGDRERAEAIRLRSAENHRRLLEFIDLTADAITRGEPVGPETLDILFPPDPAATPPEPPNAASDASPAG